MDEIELTERLVAAHRDGGSAVDPAPYAQIDRATAYRVQIGVMAALSERVGILKTGIHSNGVGVVAPIYASKVGSRPFRLPSQNVIGLEVEVGLILARSLDSDPGLDAAAVGAAVDHYFLGVEICGTRFVDRKAAGPNGGLADNMSGLGYAIGPSRSVGDAIAGLEVRLEFGTSLIHAAPAKHAFGDVLASLVAYAKAQQPSYPLRAGMVITTGSMCGLVATKGAGHVRASLGDEVMELDLD
jgi:2-keto-4-pentenoate hydratase